MGATLTLELPESLNKQLMSRMPAEEMKDFILSAAQEKINLYEEDDAVWIAEVNEAIDDSLAGRNLYTLEEATDMWNKSLAARRVLQHQG